MKKKLVHNKAYVRRSKTHGYGVFANKDLKKGEVIEECYFLITKGKDRALEDFYFDVNRKYAVFLGYGSIYNHSDEPNADYFINAKRKIATFKADKAIAKGEEILVSYGDKWFSSRGMKAKMQKPKTLKKKRKVKKKKK